MTKLLGLLVATALVALALASAAPTATPRFDTARVSEDVKTLSSDAYEGRAPATPAETKTVDYIIARMKAAGLQPGGTMKGGTRG